MQAAKDEGDYYLLWLTHHKWHLEDRVFNIAETGPVIKFLSDKKEEPGAAVQRAGEKMVRQGFADKIAIIFYEANFCHSGGECTLNLEVLTIIVKFFSKFNTMYLYSPGTEEKALNLPSLDQMKNSFSNLKIVEYVKGSLANRVPSIRFHKPKINPRPAPNLGKRNRSNDKDENPRKKAHTSEDGGVIPKP